jgi:CBS domain containing-hemolysin-like protein
LIEGSASIEDIKTQLNIELPEKKDYTSISGMFIYHFGKFPKPKNKLLINNHLFIVKTMEQRKIKDLVILPNFTLPKL